MLLKVPTFTTLLERENWTIDRFLFSEQVNEI